MINAANIRALPSGDFAGVDADIIDRHITLAASLTNAERWGDAYDAGVAYLAAHTLSVELQGRKAPSGPVASESAGPLAQSYAVMATDDALDMTPWGRLYKSLRAAIPRNPLVL